MAFIHLACALILLTGTCKNEELFSSHKNSRQTGHNITIRLKVLTTSLEMESDEKVFHQRTKYSRAMTDVSRFQDLENHLDKDDVSSLVGTMAWQALKDYVNRCHFVLVTDNIQRPFISQAIKSSFSSMEPLVFVDIKRLQHTDSHHLLTALWGSATTVCRALLIDLTSNKDDEIFRFLSSHNLSMWPETWVVIVGGTSKMKSSLYHEVFSNTLQLIYLGLKDSLIRDLDIKLYTSMITLGYLKQANLLKATMMKEKRDMVAVYSRCMYCNNGEPDVIRKFLWSLGSRPFEEIRPFPNQYINMHGHLFKIVCMPVFPFTDLRRNPDITKTKIYLRDSLDKRMIDTFASHLNFTYETHTPWDYKWGRVTENGSWNGIVGTILARNADFSTTLSPTIDRYKVVDFTRAYNSDVLCIVSLKPQLLPQYLVIIRPFTGDVWLYLLLSIIGWALALWLLQIPRSSYRKKHDEMTFATAFFFSWAVVFEQATSGPSSNIIGRILVANWLVVCLVITTGFRAALVTHLAIQGKTKPIDSLQDLTDRSNYKWGMDSRYLTGAPATYFKTSTDEVLQYIYKYIEPVERNDEAFARILHGRFSLISLKMLSRMLIDSYYTDDLGNTPYYVSKQGYRYAQYYGWGYGKGAPFRDRFDMMINHLNEAGIFKLWTDDIMASRVKENRKQVEEEGEKENLQWQDILGDESVKLRVVHLAGVFIVMLIGFGVAFVVLMLEQIAFRIS